MSHFLGEYECKMDAKGRVRLPSPLIRQLPESEEYRFVVNRGFEQCLTLYPIRQWEQISQEINALNMYNKKNRDFARYFYRGATELVMDSNDRILLPKRLLDYAGIDKDLVVFAYVNRIELWAQDKFDSMLDGVPDDFADLAQDVMGSLDLGPDSDQPSR